MSIAEQVYGGLFPGQEGEGQSFRRAGVTMAVVTNIMDPQKLGRVKCRCIADDDRKENDWCPVMSPFAGKKHGVMFFPDVGDLVVLAYINGDPQRPMVIGGVWNRKVESPYPIAGGKNTNFSIRTPQGSELHFSDVKGAEKITLTTPGGTVVVLDDGKKAVTISDKDGKNAVKLDLAGGAMELTAAKTLTLKAGSTAVTLDSSGKIELKTTKELALSAATVTAKATNKLALEGAQAELKASGKLDIQSSGVANLKGSLVKIN